MRQDETKNLKVYDAMTSSPVTINKDASVQDAALLMIDNKVASLIVSDKKKFLGLLTEKDIVRKVSAQNLDASKTKVKDVMLTRVNTVLPGADLKDAVKKIGENGQKQLPVLENGMLVGFLTFKDIMRVQPSLFGMLYEKYNIREEEKKAIYVAKGTEGVCSMCGDFSYELAAEEDEEELCPECKQIF